MATRVWLTMLGAMLAAALGTAQTPPAAEWSQWRGANRDGISAETGLLKDWPAGGPPLPGSPRAPAPGSRPSPPPAAASTRSALATTWST